jgi:hydroxyacylglutathione hydrolase
MRPWQGPIDAVGRQEKGDALLEIERLAMLNDNYVYLLFEPQSGLSAVVDPAEAAPVIRRLDELGRKLDWILTTHHHADHTGGNLALKEKTGCQIVGPLADRDRVPGIDLALGEGELFEFGEETALVLDTPGHTRGHISFWFKNAKALFCGDTLFALGCGRLFEGTPEMMWRSLSKFASMPDDTKVYCGHEYTQSNARFALTVDPDNDALIKRAAEIDAMRERGEPTIPTSMGLERQTNPFIRPHNPSIRSHLGMADASDEAVFAEIRHRKDKF